MRDMADLRSKGVRTGAARSCAHSPPVHSMPASLLTVIAPRAAGGDGPSRRRFEALACFLPRWLYERRCGLLRVLPALCEIPQCGQHRLEVSSDERANLRCSRSSYHRAVRHSGAAGRQRYELVVHYHARCVHDRLVCKPFILVDVDQPARERIPSWDLHGERCAFGERAIGLNADSTCITARTRSARTLLRWACSTIRSS